MATHSQYPCQGSPKQQQLLTEEPLMLPPCLERRTGCPDHLPPPQDRPSLGGDWPGVVFFYFLVTDRKSHIMMCTLTEHQKKKKNQTLFLKGTGHCFTFPCDPPP